MNTPSRRRRASLLLLLLSWSMLLRAAEVPWRVWVTTETRHVLRSESPGSDRNAAVFAARNETRSFQILIRSDVPVVGLRLEPGSLHGPGGAVLDRSQARLYREHQVFLTVGTYRNEAFKPDGYPDPLIPFVHPLTGAPLSGRLQAIPFDLPAEQTHGFWVDLHVPNDARAGEYRGVYKLTTAAGVSLEIPVSLTVWDFALPETPALQTSFGSPAGRLREYYLQLEKAGPVRAPDWSEVEAQCAQLMAEHGLAASPPPPDLVPVRQTDGSYRIPAERVRDLGRFVERYHVNTLEVPHPSSVVKDPVLEQEKLRAWLRAFDAASEEMGRTNLVFYTYLRDEPNTLEDYQYVQKWGPAIRSARSVVKVLVVEQTWTAPGQGGADSAWGDLYGAVDIWCPLFSLHRQESAAKRQALGESVWTYTALCQGDPTPWWHIDFPLLNYRVPAWMAWHDRMTGLLYWGGMCYWGESTDPWLEAPAYLGNGTYQQGEKGIRFNGEGSLVYPARAVGYDGVVPTIRLKALRDGIQDYEYLSILLHQGKGEQADAIATPIASSFFHWNPDPAAYDAARARLAALLGQKR